MEMTATYVHSIWVFLSRGPFSLLVALVLFACQTTSGPSANVPQGSGLDMCNDYSSGSNCLGQNYSLPDGTNYHKGMDFAAPAGTKVISATHGVVEYVMNDSCAGTGLTIATAITKYDDVLSLEVPVYAKYWHIKPTIVVGTGMKVEPGDVIGEIIPLLNSQCYGTVEHVHFELRLLDERDKHINPNLYWHDGPGNVTCYQNGVSVPLKKTVAPLRCESTYKPLKTSHTYSTHPLADHVTL